MRNTEIKNKFIGKRFFAFAALLISITAASIAQNTTNISGTLKDKKTKEPIAFAHVLINDTKHGTISDINGHFSISTNIAVKTLNIQCLGYKNITYPVANTSKALTIYMEETAKQLAEVVIKPGINPADRIVQAVIDNRKTNNFKNLDSYKYISHNRGAIEMTFDCPEAEAEKIKERLRNDTTKNSVKDIVDFMDSTYIFFTESINEYKYRKPEKVSEIVLASRTSGTKNTLFSLILTQMQTATFYKNYITIMGSRFVNPFSKGTFKRYYFEIQDTIFDGNDTIFGISFRPLMNTKFMGLKGKAYINTDRYAIQNITAAADLKKIPGMGNLNTDINSDEKQMSISAGGDSKTNLNKIDSNMAMRIKHSYERDSANRWFPKQYRFEWDFNISPKDKMVLRFFTQNDIKDVEVNAKLKRREFSDVVLDVDFEAADRDEDFWLKYRDTLTTKEQHTFMLYDSIGKYIKEDTSANFLSSISSNRIIEIFKILTAGKLPIGCINIDLNKLYNYNLYERSRWGLGLETNDKLSRWMSVGGYFGYGVEDNGWKYGGNLNFYFDRYKNRNLGFAYSQDLEAAANTLFNQYQMININNNVSYTFNRFQSVRKAEAFYKMPLIRYTTAKLSLSYSRESYLYTNDGLLYPHRDGVASGITSDFAEASLSLEWKYKQQRIRTPEFEFKVNRSWSYPTIKLLYTRGLSLFNADKEFNRLHLEYTQNIITRNFNQFSIYASAGHVSKNAPYSRMFNVIGTGNFIYYFNNSFLTLRPYSFTSTDYANICLRYDWNKSLWNTKLSKPQLSFQLNSIIGTSHGINKVDGIDIQAPEKGIVEGAICINDLLIFNISKWGIGVAYRLSSYNSPTPVDNMAIFFNIRVGF